LSARQYVQELHIAESAKHPPPGDSTNAQNEYKITRKEGSPSVMRRISGRCQRGIRYALWALGEATTMEILEYCYPWPSEDRRQRKNRARAVCLAARPIAVVAGRVWPGGNLWRLKHTEPES
jgi:hypothetical protein